MMTLFMEWKAHTTLHRQRCWWTKKKVDSVGYSGRATDIWALGVTLYCWCYLEMPFFSIDNDELINIIVNKQSDNQTELPKHYQHFERPERSYPPNAN